jgi:CBS domain-containing protein
MRQRNVGTLVILDDEKKPVGILTDRALVTRAVATRQDPRSTLVRDVMTKRPRTIPEGTSLATALELMRSGTFRRLPVVDGEGALLGLLSLDDILALIAEEMAQVAKLLEKETPRMAARSM